LHYWIFKADSIGLELIPKTRKPKKFIGTTKEKNSIETFANAYKIARPTTIARLDAINISVTTNASFRSTLD